MTPKLTDEMRQALAAQPGSPIPIADELSQQLYVLLPRDQYAQMHDNYVRRELQVAFDQADRDEWRELNIEAVIAEARRRHEAGSTSAT